MSSLRWNGCPVCRGISVQFGLEWVSSLARKTQNAQISAPLTDIQVRNAKPKAKAYTLANGGGMYLEIALTGSNTRLTFGP